MRRNDALALVALLALACGSTPADEAPAELAAHVADARRAPVAGAPGPRSAAEGDELAARILAIRDEWDRRLTAPEGLAGFVDLESETMARAREEAMRDDFGASLATGFTLDRATAGVLVRNPALRAARRDLAAAVEQYAQVTHVDTIMRQYASFLRAVDPPLGPAVPMDGASAEFPAPGTLELKAAIVRHTVEMARAKHDAAVRDVVTDVRLAYADHRYLGRAIANTSESLGFLRQLEGTVRGKLAAGSAPQSQLLQTQVEIAALENDLVAFGLRREAVAARLATLLDLPPDTVLAEPTTPEPGAFPADLAALYRRAESEQPDVRLARARTDRMATMIELAERTSYPAWSLGLSEAAGISPEGGGFATRPKTMSDPWFGGKESYLREARETARAARDRVDAARDMTWRRVKSAHAELDTARRLIALYRDVQLSLARQAYADVAAGYAADRVELLNVIDALRRWLRFHLDAERARRDYDQAHARLEAAIGGPVGREASK